jgi:hypothetical protein
MEGWSLGTSDDVVLVTIVIAILLLLVVGAVERRRHRARLAHSICGSASTAAAASRPSPGC